MYWLPEFSERFDDDLVGLGVRLHPVPTGSAHALSRARAFHTLVYRRRSHVSLHPRGVRTQHAGGVGIETACAHPPLQLYTCCLHWVRLGASSGEVLLKVGHGGRTHWPEARRGSLKSRPESASRRSDSDEHRYRRPNLVPKFSPGESTSSGCTDLHPDPSSGRVLPAKFRATKSPDFGPTFPTS